MRPTKVKIKMTLFRYWLILIFALTVSTVTNFHPRRLKSHQARRFVVDMTVIIIIMIVSDEMIMIIHS